MKISRHCPLSRSGACQCFPTAEEDEVPEGGDGRQGRGKSCKRTFNVKREEGAKLIEQTVWTLTLLLQVHWSESETRSVTENGETRNETVYTINLICSFCTSVHLKHQPQGPIKLELQQHRE